MDPHGSDFNPACIRWYKPEVRASTKIEICAGGHLTMVVRGVHYGEENDDLTKRPHATISQPSVWIGAGSWADDQK